MMVPLVFPCLALGLLVLVVSWFLWDHLRLLRAAYKLPSVVPLSFYFLLLFGDLKDISTEVHRIIKGFSTEPIKTGVVWLGPYPMFFLSDPKDIQIVLNSSRSPSRGSETNILKLFFGKGILSAPGHVWKITRRYISPVFSSQSLEQTMPVLNKCARDLTDILSTHCGSGQVDIIDDCSAMVVQASTNFTFGSEFLSNLTFEKCYGYLQYLERFRQLTLSRVFKLWLRSDILVRIWKRSDIRVIDDVMGTFLREPLKLVEDRKKCKEREKSSSCNIKGRTVLVDCLSNLQKDHPCFEEDYFSDEIKTMIQAGIETTSIIIPSCLMYLAAHPKVQERLYREVVSVLGKDCRDVTVKDLSDMPYLDRVVKETLRLSSVIPMSTRHLDQDLKLGEGVLPAGATVVLSFISMHFNPQHFPNPEQFDPDRFSPENIAKREIGTFMPFSGGNRNCLGFNYAMMSVKTFIVQVVRKLQLSNPDKPHQPRYMVGVLCRTSDGYKLALHNRNSQ